MDHAVIWLNEEEKLQTRELWNTVFAEDTDLFLDYYYKNVIKQNEILGQKREGKWISMIHLNPYDVNVGEEIEKLHYIVAVATQKEYQHQGRMRAGFMAALKWMFELKEPFTYLMPASEAIYTPFDFRTVYMQSIFTSGRAEHSCLVCKTCRDEQIPELVSFSQKILDKRTMIHTRRSKQYYLNLKKELDSMNGRILLFYNQDQLAGYCFYGNEGAAEAWEIVTQDNLGSEAAAALTEYLGKKNQLPVKMMGFLPQDPMTGIPAKEISYRPMIMVRIVHLEKFMRSIKTSEDFDIKIHVMDRLVRENEGSYLMRFSQEGCVIEKIEEEGLDSVTIAEVCECAFGIRRMEVLRSDKWKPLVSLFLNELV